MSGRPENETLASTQPGNDGAHRLLRLGPRTHAGHFEVGHFQGVDQPHQQTPSGSLKGAAINQRPHPQHRPQDTEEQERIDIARVVRQDEHGAVELLELVLSPDVQPVAPGEEQPKEGPADAAEDHHEGGLHAWTMRRASWLVRRRRHGHSRYGDLRSPRKGARIGIGCHARGTLSRGAYSPRSTTASMISTRVSSRK